MQFRELAAFSVGQERSTVQAVSSLCPSWLADHKSHIEELGNVRRQALRPGWTTRFSLLTIWASYTTGCSTPPGVVRFAPLRGHVPFGLVGDGCTTNIIFGMGGAEFRCVHEVAGQRASQPPPCPFFVRSTGLCGSLGSPGGEFLPAFPHRCGYPRKGVGSPARMCSRCRMAPFRQRTRCDHRYVRV